ncbi:hypothetical protein TB2_003402 [Malus domestica]
MAAEDTLKLREVFAMIKLGFIIDQTLSFLPSRSFSKLSCRNRAGSTRLNLQARSSNPAHLLLLLKLLFPPLLYERRPNVGYLHLRGMARPCLVVHPVSFRPHAYPPALSFKLTEEPKRCI